MKVNHRIVALLVVAAVFLTAAAMLFFGQSNVLTITNDSTGEVVFSQKIKKNELFSVSYFHSVNKSEVEEYYFIQDKSIYLDSAVYATFGAGMASEVSAPQVLEMKDGRMMIRNFNQKIDSLRYFVSVVSQNTLHVGDTQIRLDTLAAPKSSLTFAVQ